MASTRTIQWPAIVAQVQSILDGSPRPTQATINSGVIVREAVRTAGSTYDTTSTDGILNTSTYALSVQAWAATAAPLWVETDRVARAIYKLTPPPSNAMLAAFGMPGVQSWRAGTQYTVGPPIACVQPAPPNGYVYALGVPSGTSGSVQPTFSSVIGSTTPDSSSSWINIATITGPSGGQPLPLPWDLTQVTFTSLNFRATLAAYSAAANPGLVALVTNAFNVLSAALAVKPAPAPAADSASVSATTALNTAIANATAWIAASAIQ